MSIAQRMKKHRRELRTLGDILDSKVFLELEEDAKGIRIGQDTSDPLAPLHILYLHPRPQQDKKLIGVSKKSFLQDLAAQLVESDLDVLYLGDKPVPCTSFGAVHFHPERLAEARHTDQNALFSGALRDVLVWGVSEDEARLLKLTPDKALLEAVLGTSAHRPEYDMDAVSIATDPQGNCVLQLPNGLTGVILTSILGADPFELVLDDNARVQGCCERLARAQNVLDLLAQNPVDIVMMDGGSLPFTLKGAEYTDSLLTYPEGTSSTWVKSVGERGEFNARIAGLRTIAGLFGIETEISILETPADPETTVQDA